jgi:D-alanyl-D-alanine-carboxypeptidase/D-alanyl-D-alanine-endopeptidase
MISRVLLTILLAASAAAQEAASPVPEGPITISAVAAPPEDEMVDFRSLVGVELAKGHPSLSVTIVTRDQTVYSEALGVASIEKRTAVSPDTLYQIGSVTKVFTAALLVALRDRGVVTLDDPVAKYLPAEVKLPVDPRGEQMRLWHLATHTSGLPRLPGNLSSDRVQPYADYSLEKMWAGLNELRLAYPTGSDSEYSNLGSALLGQALARAADTPFETLLRREILDPLEMKATVISPGEAYAALRASGYDEKDSLREDWELNAFAPAGALWSSGTDMAKFVRWQLRAGEADVSPLSGGGLTLMQRAHFVNRERRSAHGLGWIVKSGPRDMGDIVWHNGGTGGFSSYVGMVPRQGVGVIVLTNSTRKVDAFGEELLKAAVRVFGEVRPSPADPEMDRVCRGLMALVNEDAASRAGDFETLFAPAFVAQIPVEAIAANFAQTAATHGPCRGYTIQSGNATRASVEFRFDGGVVMPAEVVLSPTRQAKIIGLQVQPPREAAASQPTR